LLSFSVAIGHSKCTPDHTGDNESISVGDIRRHPYTHEIRRVQGGVLVECVIRRYVMCVHEESSARVHAIYRVLG
jgi:hypothetical protein